jgi:hypothetical protein
MTQSAEQMITFANKTGASALIIRTSSSDFIICKAQNIMGQMQRRTVRLSAIVRLLAIEDTYNGALHDNSTIHQDKAT